MGKTGRSRPARGRRRRHRSPSAWKRPGIPSGRPSRRRRPRRRRRSDSYDHKILQRLRRGNHNLSCQARGLLREFLNGVYTEVSSAAERLRRRARLPSVGSSHVKAAVQEVMEHPPLPAMQSPI